MRKFIHGADAEHFAVAQDGHPDGDAPSESRSWVVMRWQLEPFAQLLDQLIKTGGADRISPEVGSRGVVPDREPWRAPARRAGACRR
jgi:hypothetical protein